MRALQFIPMLLVCSACCSQPEDQVQIVPLHQVILSTLDEIDKAYTENSKQQSDPKIKADYYPCSLTATYTVNLGKKENLEEDASATIPLYVPLTIGVKHSNEQDTTQSNEVKVDFKTLACDAKNTNRVTPIAVKAAVTNAIKSARSNLSPLERDKLATEIIKNIPKLDQ